MKNNVLGYNVEELKQLVNLYPWFSWAREELLYKVVDIEPECLDDFYSNNLIFFPKRELVLFNAKNISREKSIKHNVEKPLLPDEKPFTPDEKSPIEEKEELVDEKLNEDYSKEVDLVNEKVVEEDNFAVDFTNIGKEKDLSGEKLVEEDDEETDNIEDNECYSLMDRYEEEEIVFEKENLDKKIMVVGGDYFSKQDFDALSEDEKVGEIRITPFGNNTDGKEVVNSGLEKEINYDLPEFYTETLAKIYTDQECYKEAIDVYAKLILLYPEKSAYFASLVKEIKLKN